MRPEKRSRPGDETKATEVHAGGPELNTILRPIEAESPESPTAVFFRNSYAVLVQGKQVRRHLYFNLPAAERAVKRALLRGDKAALILVRLVPVDARHLDEGEAIR